MSGTGRSTMKEALFGRAGLAFPTFGPGVGTHARREGLKNGIQAVHDGRFTANHHAIAAVQPPDPTADTHVHVVQAMPPQFFGAADVVVIMGVAAVDYDVVTR